MYTLSINMWFQKLMKQFFFGIDSVVYNAISSIYDLLISIARTSILTQADILDMADRIYKLLAIFMIFKVTLSLITYVVNPDDFSDKSKGVSKLSMNIVISLGLLILTPYIFNLAYRAQTIILEDNTLGTLIFGDDKNNKNADFLNSAGDDMAFITMNAFFTPNISINELQGCVNLTENGKVRKECSGLNDDLSYAGITDSMAGVEIVSENFDLMDLKNYVVGVNNKNLGLTFRQELAIATTKNNEFVMDYKYIFSTVVGVVVVLLLISFCMDVALRSIKLAFLQLIAPIPILSYIDPKSGKDGMFKKWYELCFKTYLSLFIRLLALYFAIYIIQKVSDLKLVDAVDGTYQTHAFIYIFVIIGALMFAKDFPKILESLGIKLDGGGKFTLNPLKKFEDQAQFGKNATGLARGLLTGTAGALSGAGIGRGISGAWRGMTSGKGWKETGKAETEMNKKMRQARLDGSTFGGRLGSRVAGAMGLPTRSESIEGNIHRMDEQIKNHQNTVKAIELEKEERKSESKERARRAGIVTKSMGDAKTTFIEKMKDGVGVVGSEYRNALNIRDTISGRVGDVIEFTDITTGKTTKREVTESDVTAVNNVITDLEQNGWKRLVDEQIATPGLDAKLQTKLDVVYTDYATANGVSEADARAAISSGSALNAELGTQAGNISREEAAQRRIDEEYYEEIKSHNDEVERLEEEKRALYERQRIAKADDSTI